MDAGSGGREARSVFSSTAGGVMTAEVGAITGELELATRVEDGRLSARVRYAGAEEWYAVEGSPVPLEGALPPDPNEVHRRLVEHLRRPGPVEDGNEAAVFLAGFSPGGM